MDAIEAGGKTAAALVTRLDELEKDKQAITAEMAATVPAPIRIAPNLRSLYVARVEGMVSDLVRDDESRARAVLALRTVITRVVLTPLPVRGQFEIEVLGDEIGMITLAIQDLRGPASSHTVRLVAEEGPTPGSMFRIKVRASGRG